MRDRYEGMRVYKYYTFSDLQKVCWNVIIKYDPSYRICDFINLVMNIWGVMKPINDRERSISEVFILEQAKQFKQTFMWDITRDSYLNLLN